jgi:hypothetical protein
MINLNNKYATRFLGDTNQANAIHTVLLSAQGLAVSDRDENLFESRYILYNTVYLRLALVLKCWLRRKQPGNLEISAPETTSDTSELGLGGNKQMNFRLGDSKVTQL